MFRFLLWVARQLGGRGRQGAPAAQVYPVGEPVAVQLPDGRVVEGRRIETGPTGSRLVVQGDGGDVPSAYGPNQTIVLTGQPGGPGRGPRRAFGPAPRWAVWTVLVLLLIGVFRRAVAWAVLAALSAVLHLFGANFHLPHVTFGWPWSSATTQSTLVGPLVLQKIEGIDKPALGSETFDFMFSHSVSKPIGFLPCWYSASFYAVGHASATVDLNPGPAWWKPKTGHYVLRVLSRPSGGAPGKVAIAMALPLPQLPQSVHDVSVDNTLSAPTNVDHSWTYPGLACGLLIRPQFSPSVLYAQAQQEAFTQATTTSSVTKPLIAAAEGEATKIIGGNFIAPTLNALGYKVSSFAIHWVAAGKEPAGNGGNA
jgi:hypothetical protein